MLSVLPYPVSTGCIVKNRLFFSLALIYFLVACATTSNSTNNHITAQGAYSERNRSSISENIFDATIFVAVPQDHIIGEYIYHPNPMLYSGLLGAFQASKEYKQMLKDIKPLIDSVDDLDFSTDLINALRGTLIFTNPENIIPTSKPLKSKKDIKALIDSAPTDTAILIQTVYRLDYSYTSLTINSDLTMWSKNQSKPLYASKIVYNSKPVTFDHSFFVRDRAMPLWTSNRGANYRSAQNEGINESVDLINIALTDNENDRNAGQEYTFFDYTDQSEHSGWLYKSDSLDRRIMKTGIDNYYSIPSYEPTYDSLKKKIGQIPSGKSRLYVFRPAGGAYYQPNLIINGEKFSTPIYMAGFFYIDLLPGKYTFTLDQDSDNTLLPEVIKKKIKKVQPLALGLLENEEYYLEFAFNPRLFGRQLDFEVVPRDMAMKSIRSLQYKGSEFFSQ